LARSFAEAGLEPAPSLFCVASSINQDKIKFKKSCKSDERVDPAFASSAWPLVLD
jgi:hypothetical protein